MANFIRSTILRSRFAIGICLLLVTFWLFTLWNLSRFPVIHQDEPWILSPGYKLFALGIYGSDFFTGFYGMEQHYLQFMPLMSILEGALTHIAGANLFVMRFVPVACALITLALVFRLGKSVASPNVGLLAGVLLVSWAWLPAGGRALGSGVPLIDLARIVRYDILVVPLGLAALLLFVRSQRGERRFRVFAAGIFAGLAGLAHLYGLFWLGALGMLVLIHTRHRLRSLFWLATGAALVWFPWLLLLENNWNDYLAQIFSDRALYNILSPEFFLQNLLMEPQRYHFNFSVPGAWLLAAGVPLALLYALWRVRRHEQLLLIVVPAVILTLLMALLVSQKLFNYLVTIVPLFALLIAVALLRLWRLRWIGPALCGMILLIVCGSGIVQMQQMQARANQTSAPGFLSELRAAIPEGNIVLGHPQYALPFIQGGFRSTFLLFLFADPNANLHPVTMSAALLKVAPQYIIFDPAMQELFSDQSSDETRAWSGEFHAFMREHRATMVARVFDQESNPLLIFRLDP